MKAVGCALSLVLGSVALAQDPQQAIETFYQQVDIERQPRFSVQGINAAQQIHYRIQSSFEVHPADERGNRKVVQTITDAVLIAADPMSKAVFAQSLAAMPGRSYTYKLSRYAEVVSMEGHRDNLKAVEVEKKPESAGMLMTNVIDEDGWKELAQWTLFQPLNTGRTRRTFSRRTTHDWGSLGSWYGKTNFTAGRAAGDRRLYRFEHQLQYTPPEGPATQVTAGIPLEIQGAKFRLYDARGEIDYDRKRERVRTVREIFHAGGTVSTTMLGIQSAVDIDETQSFTITVTPARKLRVPPSSP